jgi:hypothetical protein
MQNPQSIVGVQADTVTVTVEPDRDLTVSPDPRQAKSGGDVEWYLVITDPTFKLKAYVMPLETVALIPDDEFGWDPNHGMHLKKDTPPHARAHKNPETPPRRTDYRITVVFDDKPDLPRTVIGSVLIVE